MRKLVFAAVVIGLARPAAAQPVQAVPNEKIGAIFESMAKPYTPGCAVGVSSDGERRISTYGVADLEHGIPLSPGTIFEAGSVSKQFTAAAVLLLVQDNKLALDDDVRKHLPELPDYGRKITIDHLLNHTSGLRDWGSVAELGGWPRGTRVHEQSDAVEIIRRQRSLNYDPGAEYSYTNSGYNLLTEVVRRVSGESLATFSSRRMFVPLGMTKTSWRDDFRRPVRNRAIAYGAADTGFAQDMPFENVYGNGGLLTTVDDLLTWNDALAKGRLGAAIAERLQQPAVLNDGTPVTYARGLFVERHRGVPAIVHSGSTGGYRAWLGRFPDQRLSVAVLCNRADANATVLAKQVADLFLPAGPPVAQVPDFGGAKPGGLFVNTRTGQSVRIGLRNGQLMMDETIALAAIAPGRFRHSYGELEMIGEDRFRAFDLQGQTIEFRRAEPASPDAARLASYAGRYNSDEVDAAYLVAIDGAGLKMTLEGRAHIVVRLVPTYADTFENDEVVARFRRGPAGNVVAVAIGIPRIREALFVRTETAGK